MSVVVNNIYKRESLKDCVNLVIIKGQHLQLITVYNINKKYKAQNCDKQFNSADNL